MKNHSRSCGRRCLGPMKFLPGVNGQEQIFASRDTSSHTDKLVFICRSVKPDEKIKIQFRRGLLSQDGHRAIGIGFTNDSPLNAVRDLRQNRRSCVVPVPEDLCLPGAEIEFWMNYAGFAIIRAGGQKYYMNTKGLKLHAPVFVFLDFHGSTSTVCLLGSRKGTRKSCPVEILPKQQSIEENLLNLTLTSNDNANTGQTVFREAPVLQPSRSPWPACPPVSTDRSSPPRQSKQGLKRRIRSSVEETDVISLLKAFQLQYLSSNEVHVMVRRKRLLNSALDALSNWNFSWDKKPFIQFADEDAFDNGGPRREFLVFLPFRLLMIEVQSRMGIFEGKPKQLFFTYDQNALQQRKYEQAGKLVAWSIVHGGPGLKALNIHLYQLMCGVEMDLTDFDWRLIPDADVQNKAQEILSCNTADKLWLLQRELGDWICDCGFPGIYGPNIGIQDIPKIYSYIVRHYIYLRVLSMINQFTEGLNSCGNLWDIVKRNWMDFLPFFIKPDEQLSMETFRALFEISWSEAGSSRRAEEEKIIHYWELVLKLIENKQTDLSFKELLVFITASDQPPVLGFPEKLSIHFYEPDTEALRLPYSSTCMMGLFLPRRVNSHLDLHRMLLRAVRDSNGFGKA